MATVGESSEMGSFLKTFSEQMLSITKSVNGSNVVGMIKSFDGTSGHCKEWVKEIEKHALLCSYNDADTKKLAYRTATGAVSDFINRWLNANPLGLWVDLKAEIAARFGEFSDTQHCLTLLRKNKQRKDENIQVYSERVLSMAEEAFSGQFAAIAIQQNDLVSQDNVVSERLSKIVDKKSEIFTTLSQLQKALREQHAQLASARFALEQQLIGYFVDGLYSNKIKFRIMKENPRSVQNAMDLAVNEQNFMKRFYMRTGTNVSEGLTVTKEEHEPMEVDKVSKRKCYKCDKYGHIARNCRTKMVSAVSKKEVDLSNVECYYCHEKGHYKSHCQKLKEKQANKAKESSEN